MKQAIQTPFGSARFFYDGERYAHLEFDAVKLGRIWCKGYLTLAKNTDDRYSWGDETWHLSSLSFSRTEGFMVEITPGAREFIHSEIIPWMRKYLENPEILSNGMTNRLVKLIESCEDDIQRLEKLLQEKRDNLQKLRADLDDHILRDAG